MGLNNQAMAAADYAATDVHDLLWIELLCVSDSQQTIDRPVHITAAGIRLDRYIQNGKVLPERLNSELAYVAFQRVCVQEA